MDKSTLKALEGSIEKWRQIVEEGGADEGTENCPLCTEFLSATCEGCPVQKVTGEQGCNGSPYDIWVSHIVQDHILQNDPRLRKITRTGKYSTTAHVVREIVPGCDECEKLARAELDFLRSLAFTLDDLEFTYQYGTDT